MKKMSETIVFFGSGPVAAASLRLLEQDFSIETVITKPVPAHHKTAAPVLETCKELGLEYKLVDSKASLDSLVEENVFKSKAAILIDFGIIVSQKVIDTFPKGIINSHFSLLPQWRGADPITFAVLSGQDKTGVTLMLINEGMDTGKLIGQATVKLDPNIDTPTLTQKLINVSHRLLVEKVPQYLAGEIIPRNQPHPDRATYSRKLQKNDGIIDWNKSAVEIEREVRAFVGWPGSRATIFDKDVILTKVSANTSHTTLKPGECSISTDKKAIIVGTAQGTLLVEKLKPLSKNEMPASAFIAGYIR